MEKKCKEPVWRFTAWSILELKSAPIRQSTGTYIYATITNCPDPTDPNMYVATITREISTGMGIRSEEIGQKSFEDLFSALLYLEVVDLGEHKANRSHDTDGN